MSGRASPEPRRANNDHFAPKAERPENMNSRRKSRHRPSTQPAPRWPDTQQVWDPLSYHPYNPQMVPYGTHYMPPPQVATQSVPTRWEAFDLFDEEEQERRRKKGKELVPVEPMRTRPPPWTGNDAGYGPAAFGPAAFGPTGNPSWPALPPAQGEPIPPLPPRAEMRYDPTKLSQPVHHPHQWPGLDRHYGYHIPQSEIRLNRQVDGILTPSSGDLTVQLTMDLQEDLGDQLDELARLSRLGHFLSAQDYFNENLQHHMANPYVFVQYADMLLRQGNFQGIRLIKSTPMDKHDEEISNSDGQMTPPTNKEMRTLHANWELIQLLAKSHTLGLLSGVPDVFAEAVDVLYDPGMTNEPSVSSTEVRVVLPYDEVRITNRQIQILGLTLHLTSHPALNLKWLEHGGRALDAFPTSLSRLYPTLLRQGRIWDFHDLVVLLPTIEDVKALTHDIFRKEFIPSLETMVSDWSDSVHGYDSSTTMALLSILTHIILSPIQASEHECIAVFKLCLPLAISVMENDPANLRSRPYLRLLLAKSRFAETASRRAIDTLASHLQSSPGVCYSPEIALLPLYVPSGDEIPEWTPSDQSSELKDPVRLVLRSATELGDYETEVMAHQELIRLSSDPRDDLDRLCDLQLSRQGDLNGFSLSLASKYFVATTQQAREELSTSISHLLPKVVSTHYWDPSRKWILNMILYKLEGRSPMRIRRILERSGSDYQGMDKSLLREISRKMPILKDWANSQVGSGSKTERKATVLQAGHVSPPVYKPPARRAKNTTSMRTAERPHAPTQQRTANEPAKERDTPLTTASIPRDNLQDRHVQHQPSPPLVSGPVLTGESSSMVIQVDKTHEEDARRVAKIKAEVEAEFNRKIEDEEVSERKRREERMAVLEGLKKEVEAIRREAVEQAERKALVEARERMEQQRWERRMEEIKLQNENERAKAKAAAAELDAKLETTRKIAFQEAEERMREEFELRKMREDEARRQAELETNKRIEAEKRAYEEAKASEELREQLRLKAEAELRERHAAEHRAYTAAAKKIEEDDHKEEVRNWAAEVVEEDLRKKDLKNKDQIHLKDAVGRKIAVPFSQGRTWQGMEELIHAAFRHVDLVGPEVLAGHFDLLGPDGAIILPQTWDDIVQPGWNITMLMWPMVGPSGPSDAHMIPPPPKMTNAPPRAPDPPRAPGPPPLPPSPFGHLNAVVVEPEVPDAQSTISDISDYEISVESWKPSRRERIANAFTALRSSIFRRHRRRASSPSVTSTSVSASSVSASTLSRSERSRR